MQPRIDVAELLQREQLGAMNAVIEGVRRRGEDGHRTGVGRRIRSIPGMDLSQRV